MSPRARRPSDDPPAVPTDETKTAIYAPRRKQPETQRGHQGGRAAEPPATGPAGASQPIRMTSHKTPGFESDKFARPLPEVRLRSVDEVRTRTRTPAHGLGNLAPPRDPRQARTRRVQDYVIWGSAAVIVASIVMLLVWFLAR